MFQTSLLNVIILFDSVSSSYTNFVVKQFSICPSKHEILISGNITHEGNYQYFDADFTLPYDVGQNIGVTVFIEHALNSKNFLPVFTIKEKDSCKAANKYLGEYWYDLQRAAQISPRVCPVQAGRYHLHHFKLNHGKISLQTFPFGSLKFTFNLINNRNSDVVACFYKEVENLFN